MENILYIEKMGCDFYIGDDIEKVSDLVNHRFYIKNIELKDGRVVDTIEISSGARYTNDKYNNLVKIDMFGLWLHTYYNDTNENCIGLSKIDKKINKKNFNISVNEKCTYTQKNLLKIINSISKKKYNKIKMIERY